MIEGRLKGAIFRILGESWPHTAKEIYHIAKKRYNTNVSYQAIFKAMQELCSAGIVEKEHKQYALSAKWLFSKQVELSHILEKYTLKEKRKQFYIGPWSNRPEVLDFVLTVGPGVLRWISDEPLCIATVSRSGDPFALALRNWLLLSKGLSINYIDFPVFRGIKLTKEFMLAAKDRFLLFVDSAINTGRTYRRTMQTIRPVLKRWRIRDLRWAVRYDMRGLAEWSLWSGTTAPAYSEEMRQKM